MSFRIANVVASIPVVSVTSTSVTTASLSEQVVGAGIRINEILVRGNIVYAGGVSLKNTVSDKSVSLVAPSILPADYQLSFPSTDGASGEVLGTDGANHLQWIPSGTTTEFKDDVFRVSNAATTTKKIAFNAASISDATTRTITMPDADVSLAAIPNQSVDTSSSPTFVAINANNVNTDNINEKTALAGISLSSNSKKCFLVKPGVATTYDENEKVTETKHTKIGSVATGGSIVDVCTINIPGDGSACYIDFSVTAQNGAIYETYNSFKLLATSGGVLSVTNIVDITKHDNWSYGIDGLNYKIKLQQDGVNTKYYCAIVKVQPITNTSTYTITFA